ncbi:hypothetical protein COF63_29155, partial [Bacillus pseudomycoides]
LFLHQNLFQNISVISAKKVISTKMGYFLPSDEESTLSLDDISKRFLLEKGNTQRSRSNIPSFLLFNYFIPSICS